MAWWVTLSGGVAILLAAFMTGAPIFVAFLVINIAGVMIFLGEPGFGMVANSIFETTNVAAMSAVPLFILMGELLFRSGWLSRSYIAVRLSKVQSVRLRQSPFDRRHRMAHLQVDTAGTRGETWALEIPYLDLPVASSLAAHLAREAARRDFQWS